MVIMALDHTRDFFSNFTHNPTDLAYTTTGMFFTRWITHFCAPVFIFLAGTSAYLSLAKKNDKKAASLFLLKRGIWLIVLEVTIVRFGWMFNLDYAHVVMQVIWAIGWSMVFLAGLIHLPFYAILSIGLLMILGHNALDNIQAETMTSGGFLWNVLHDPDIVKSGDNNFYVFYSLIPWIGVMATGYCFGKLLQRPDRNKWLYITGVSAIVLFIVIRASNVYGDPYPWSVQESWDNTLLSFLNCNKYPPSLLYLCMTLGPAILLMPLLDKMDNAIGRFFKVFGSVPMFYYILHIYLIHGMALALGVMLGLPSNYFTDSGMMFTGRPGWGYGLSGVYLAWVIAVLLLYFPSKWFMKVKQQHKKWWLSYI
jgi:uncharacterized membrane protein